MITRYSVKCGVGIGVNCLTLEKLTNLSLLLSPEPSEKLAVVGGWLVVGGWVAENKTEAQSSWSLDLAELGKTPTQYKMESFSSI